MSILKLSKLGANVDVVDQDGGTLHLYVTEGQLFDGDTLTVTTPSGVKNVYTLKPGEVDRLNRHGALVPEADPTGTEVALAAAAETQPEGGDPARLEIDVSQLGVYDVASLAAWIEQDKPTIAAIVAAAGTDPALAQRLVEAEQTATKGDPRKGLVEALSKVAAP